MAITTVNEYRAWSGIDTNTDDTFLATLVSAAQELAENEIGYTLDGSTRTEDHSGAGVQEITLRARPVVSVTSVTPLGADSVAGTAWAATDYKFDAASGILSLTPRQIGRYSIDEYGTTVEPYYQFDTTPQFADEFQNVRIVYLAGWGSSPYTAAPSSLKVALWRIIDVLYRTNRVATGNADAGSAGSVEEVVKTVMAHWKRAYP